MSKPREFWISEDLTEKIIVFKNYRDAQYMENAVMARTFHVIEKRAVNTLIDALENIVDYDCEGKGYAIAIRALKEYKGGDYE